MRASRWLSGLTRRLRDAGVVVPPSRLMDAARALVALDAEPDLALLRDALRVTLTQSRDEGRVFDGVFNRYMAAHARAVRKRRGPRATTGPAGEGQPGGAPTAMGGTPPPTAPRPESTPATRSGAGQVGASAEKKGARPPRAPTKPEGVGRKGREPQPEPRGDARNPEELDDEALGAWIEALAAEAEDEDRGSAHGLQAADARAAATAAARSTTRRAAERAVVRNALAPLESEGRVQLPDLPLYSPLTPAEDALILDTVRRMARLMWIRRARRSRRWKSGRLSVKSTITQSIRSGGIPFKLVRRKRKLRLARLLLLLDVSGSVRTAARFLLALAQALRRAFSSVRAFAFVNRPVDATALLERDPLPRLEDALPDVDWLGKSDYGNTFYKLLEDFDGALTRDTLLVVLGDARNNYADPMPWTLAQIRTRVGRLVWLNPEPRKRWHTADSALAAYAPYCDALERCATTADLRHIADRWLHLAARWR